MRLLTVGLLQDLLGGLGPDEGVAAVAPAVDERADVGVELADGAKGAAVDGLALDDAGPGLDQVQPRAAGRVVVHLDPGVLGQSVADLDPLVRGGVVHHQVQFDRVAVLMDVVGVGLRDRSRKVENSWWRCLCLHAAVTFPVATSNAANRVEVPCRT